MRVMALDVGTKTVGIAVSDELGLTAHPCTTLSRRGVKTDVEAILVLANARDVEVFVVGLPFELDGSEGRSARLARQIGEALVQAGHPVHLVDERFTSVEAERILIAQGVRRSRRKEVIDQVAAMLILNAWLEHGKDAVEEVLWPKST